MRANNCTATYSIMIACIKLDSVGPYITEAIQ